MIIKNPTKNPIEVDIFGVHYRIEAEDSLENVPEATARYWQENLHSFLILRKDKEAVVEPVAMQEVSPAVVDETTLDAAVEEAAEEIAEAVVEAVHKKVAKKTTKK